MRVETAPSICVVIPVGPGHGEYAVEAQGSVRRAWHNNPGNFGDLTIRVVDDGHGRYGRSKARNLGVASSAADWYFLLDADDRMLPGAFAECDFSVDATFGRVFTDLYQAKNVYPVTRETLLELGARGTLSMGMFVRGTVARATPFDETLDAGEDFDFYLRLPSFVKKENPLVEIGRSRPSAGGPRGYKKLDWFKACDDVLSRYRPTTGSRTD